MEFRRHQAKLEKKAKKKAKSSTATRTTAENGTSEDGPSTSKKAKLDETSTVNGKVDGKLVNGTAVGASTSKVVNGSSDDKLKFKSIQQDPKASSVFKSLFTTSEKAKKQPKGHWVTYNPQYN